jgi:ribonuclease BN (tRNA processing enzyme)
VYSDAGLAKRTADWQSYHSRYHTSARALAEIANQAKPGLLILHHQLLWSSSKEVLLQELQATYSGKVAYGNDLDVY